MSSKNPIHRASSILIIGGGVFGISTVHALLTRPAYANTHITVVDSRTPAPGSDESTPPPTASHDSSRIIRPDYASLPYSKLAAAAQTKWRQSWLGPDVYRETGLLLCADGLDGPGAGERGWKYVTESLENVRRLGASGLEGWEGKVDVLAGREDVERVMGCGEGAGNGRGGYINWGSGWADASLAMERIREKVGELASKRVTAGFKWDGGKVEELVFGKGEGRQRLVTGVRMADGRTLEADLVVVAAGAWSGTLIPEAGNRLQATGQVLGYIQLQKDEVERLKHMPVLLNMSTGMFVIPPDRHDVLKVARHGFGYENKVSMKDGRTISIPGADFHVLPKEGEIALRKFLKEIVPWLGNREFAQGRVCWYTDTATGDFLIDRVPSVDGLFIATGGSGHGFKFLPVIGEKIVDAIEGTLDTELKKIWEWREKDEWGEGDGSRGGPKGMQWEEELEKNHRQH